MARNQMNLKTFAMLALLLFVIASTWACAPKRLSGKANNTPDLTDTSIPGFLSLQENLADQDTTPLQGRRIVLDPGHGGRFPGAVGPGGQKESDANLGVALYLRGLLEWAGATVYMTRTSDHDFLSPADSTLSSDLAFRVSFTDSLQPDVFLSIHHNSTASADPTINETQTYYPLGDEGASLDLARAIHRHLVINLNISPAKIMPGNFHVLRNATVPAVLGEPAMISNPVMAGRLSQAASLKLEAEAYFLGILDYFATGTPSFSSAMVIGSDCMAVGDTITCTSAQDHLEIQWHFKTRKGEPGPDPASFQLFDGKREAPFSISPNGVTVTWRGKPHSHEPQTLRLSGRNLTGRSTPPRLTLILPAVQDQYQQTLIPEHPTNPGSRLTLRHWSEKKNPSSPQPKESWSLVPAKEGGTEAPLPPGLQWHLLKGYPQEETSWRERFPLIKGISTQFVQNYYSPAVALPFIEGDSSPVWIELPGFLPLVDPQPSRSDISRTVFSTARHWPLLPLVPQMQGKVIVLDAAGGGTINQGQAPLGTRGSDLNLETVYHLQRLLAGAGAKVLLTRDAEATPRAAQKVQLANDVHADFFLSVARNKGKSASTAILHHPQSKGGKTWAISIDKYLQPLLDKKESLTVSPDWAYLLRHTACPAVTVQFPIPMTILQENKRRTPAWAQAEARALFLALVEQVIPAQGPLDVFEPGTVIESLPSPAFALSDISWVLVDGNFPWYPAPKSFFVSSQNTSNTINSSAGPGLPELGSIHTLELHTSHGWQLWIWKPGTPASSAKLLLEGK